MLKSLFILYSNHIIYAHTPSSLHTILFTTVDLQYSLNFLSLCTFVRDFPGRPSGKEPACQYNAGDIKDVGLIPELGRSPGEGNDNPLQYLAWEIPRTEEPDGLQSMGSHRVQHDLAAQQQQNFHYLAVQRLGLESEMSYGNLRTLCISIPAFVA